MLDQEKSHPEPGLRRRRISGVKYISLFGAIGYFTAAKRYMLGLKAAGIPFTWTPLVPSPAKGRGHVPYSEHRIGDEELDPYCNRPIEYDTVIMHTPPELYPALIAGEAGRHLFGYAVWETENIPKHWPLLLNRVDHLLVPSLWNRDVFKNNGVHVPITVIPHIVPTVEPTPRRAWKNIDPGLFIFYIIETWTARKNIDQTIRLYLQTFSAQDHSLLVIKTFPRIYRHNPFTQFSIAKSLYNHLRRRLRIPGHTTIRPDAAGWLKRLASIHPAGARVLLLTEELSEGDIRGLHRRGNCYVSLSHAEGWGLGAFDAAATGNPVIMTGYGGQADYLDEECAGVVGYDMVPARDDDNPQKFNKRQQWAEPRAQEVAALMRRIYENAPAAREKARQWQVRLREKFSQEVVTRRLLDVLENG